MADTGPDIARVWYESQYRSKYLAAARALIKLDNEARKSAGGIAGTTSARVRQEKPCQEKRKPAKQHREPPGERHWC
jgi:hypothetical protein